ncbi:MAG: hypothetical protein HY537_11405 [Deltaproteobacteria bacterium]|nr:hypothetical protein [Deltaproteobacteria bacterium]
MRLPENDVEDFSSSKHFHIGSLNCRLRVNRPEYADYVAQFLKQDLERFPDWKSDFDLILEDCPSIDARISKTPAEGCDFLSESSLDGKRWLFSRGNFLAYHIADASPPRLACLAQRGVGDHDIEAYFHLMLNRAMVTMGFFYLHAAGIVSGKRGLLFCGEKGTGKSTLSVALGKADAIVLADDHVLLKRGENVFTMSGTSSMARITEQTERHFFAQGLRAKLITVGGTKKKEFELSEQMRALPFQDVKVTHVFFPEVTGKYALYPLSQGAALFHWLRLTRHLLIHPEHSQEESYMNFFSRLAVGIPAWRVELPADLAMLTTVVKDLTSL